MAGNFTSSEKTSFNYVYSTPSLAYGQYFLSGCPFGIGRKAADKIVRYRVEGYKIHSNFHEKT